MHTITAINRARSETITANFPKMAQDDDDYMMASTRNESQFKKNR